MNQSPEPAAEAAYKYATLENPLRGPRASLASRKIARKSEISGRAVIAAMDPNGLTRQIIPESITEMYFTWVALADRRIVFVREQPPAVKFVGADGKTHSHTFDVELTLADGRKVLVAVRAADRAKKVRAIVKAIAHQTKGLADAYLLVTEAQLPRWKVRNAQLILSCRKDEDRSADDKLRMLVAGITAPVRISHICQASGLGGAAFRALVRLIDLGELDIAHGVRIEWNAFVSRTAVTGKEAA